jgi:hypothetical protein
LPKDLSNTREGRTKQQLPMVLKKLRTLLFHKDSFFLVSFFVLLWLTISLIADSGKKTSDLIRHTGVVLNIDSVIIEVKDKPLFKQTTQELRLIINTEPACFMLTTTGSFRYVTSKIKIGDTVTIFTKPRTLMVFGLRKENDISQLVKGGITIINYQQYRTKAKKLSIMFAISTIAVGIIYYIRTKKRFPVTT